MDVRGKQAGWLLAAALLGGCGSDSGSNDLEKLFSGDTAELVVEVDYQPGADPYTGNGVNGNSMWTLTRENLLRLFPGRTIRVPTEIGDMQELGDVSGASFNVGEILDIEAAHRDTDDSASIASFYVVFLEGVFEENGEERDDVLGINITGTRVIAMFKPVIRSTEGPLMLVSRFVEQATLVHELGHAVGLVNNGIPLASQHHDQAHGAHCSNSDCVMYYLNEGANDLADFVRDYIGSNDIILFGDECIADVEAFRGTP